MEKKIVTLTTDNKLSYSDLMEDLVHKLGGCGRYQCLTGFIVQSAKTMVAMSMIAMAFMGQQPDFRCRGRLRTSDQSEMFDNECKNNNGTCVEGYEFESYENSMKTIVTEFSLVCGDKWITATITTIQMCGVLIGCLIAGHLGDHIGRKPTFYLAISVLIVFNVVAIFPVNWQLYAAVRFVLGMGVGSYLTVHYNLVTEFVPTPWRARIVAVPAWSSSAGFFALMCWTLKNWKYVHLVTAAVGVPFLFTYCFVQESMRWLITRGKYEAAESVITRIAQLNRKGKPDISKVIKQAAEYIRVPNSRHHSVLTLFKTWKRARLSIALMFIWMSMGYSYYSLTFGIHSLSGNLYLNMFLMNIIEAPVKLCIMYLVNKFGRKKCCIFFFAFNSVCGLTVTTIQYVDSPYIGVITNVCAFASKLSISLGWGCLIVFTPELFPTVVRTISYGLCNTSARIGSIAAPQIVFLNDSVPGLMYAISAVLLFISTLFCFTFPETNGKVFEDTYEEADDISEKLDSESDRSQNTRL